MRLLRILLSLGLLVLVAACASTKGTPRDLLERNQYAWSGAIRWGDFEGALNLTDPDLREEQAQTPLQLERYKQVRISSYRDLGASADLEQGTATRDVEIGVVNEHTQAERKVRYREQWRWDEEARTWWVTSGLPDLWDGR